MKTTRKRIFAIIIPLLLAAIAAGLFFALSAAEMKKAPPAQQAAERLLDEAIAAGIPESAKTAVTADGQRLYEGLEASWDYSVAGTAQQSGRNATVEATVRRLDLNKLSQGLNGALNQILVQIVAEARYSGDVYNEDFSYKPEAVKQAFERLVAQRFLEIEEYCIEEKVTLEMRYTKGQWTLKNPNALERVLLGWVLTEDVDKYAGDMRAAATETPEYARKHYSIAEGLTAGPVPDAEGFGVTDDPAVIEALLETPIAKQLIGEEKLSWNRDIPRIPGTSIRYYLDETILVLVWQEETARAVGTYSEVIIADGSQLRRKLAGDEFESRDYKTVSDFAKDTNSVLAIGGDFYHYGRDCGIVVYDRKVLRFEPYTCEICYFTSDGEMLFSQQGQFESIEQAQAFVDENDVIFSLAFGPIIIENRQDVTPPYYSWGEITDEYARSTIGVLGPRHYLTQNVNCEYGEYYFLITLQQATDAMLAHGCIKAYTLDGGQTATTVFNGELINAVQHGSERLVSDIVYFASAIPNE